MSSNSKTSRAKLDDLLVHGYLRLESKNMKIIIPTEIVKMCFIWYHEKYEILTWSEKYKSEDTLILSDDNKCVTRKMGSENINFQWILCDTKPVHSGIHCWRVKQINPNSGWVTFGVSAVQMFHKDGFRYNNMWGVTFNDCWYGNGRHLYHPQHKDERNNAYLYNFKNDGEIDIYLDCDKREMKLCIVGIVDKAPKNNSLKTTQEAKLSKIEQNSKTGWVPFINTGTPCGQILRIAKILPEWYGEHYDGIFPEQ